MYKNYLCKKIIQFLAVAILILPLSVYADTNNAPVLDSTKSPALSSIEENSGVPVGAVGTLISTLVDFATPAGQVDNVTDIDVGASLGIAVIASNENLTCYFTLNGGSSWSTIGSVSNSSARLLAADADNRIYCQPDLGVSGSISDAITFRAWDQTSGTDGNLTSVTVNGATTAFSTSSDTASINITEVSTAPNGTNLSAAETYTEDTTLNLIDIVATDVDSANVTATLTLSNISVGALSTATSGAVTSTFNSGIGVWTATGPISDVNILLASIVFAPSLNYNSSFVIATSVTDGIAAAITGTKTFTGIAVNDAPTATKLSTSETYIVNMPSLDLVDIVITDVDSASVSATLTLSSTSVGTLTTGTSGAVTSTYVSGTGVWTATGAIANVNTLLASVAFIPAPDSNAEFTMATSVSDGIAAAVTGTKSFNVNATPNALNDSYEIVEDEPVTLFVLANDYDDDIGDLITITEVSSPTFGNAVIDEDTISYTPNADYFGEDSFTYTIEDDHGSADTATVYVTISNTNDAPVAEDDLYDLDEDATTTIFDVLNNDYDLDDEMFILDSISETDNGGSISLFANQIQYTPAENFNGIETFTYTIIDGDEVTDTALVTINVASVNDAPTANNDSYTVTENSNDNPLTPLENDIDIEDETVDLTINRVEDFDNGGSATIDGNQILYTPADNFVGIETFSYIISDTDEGANTGTITIEVTAEETPRSNRSNGSSRKNKTTEPTTTTSTKFTDIVNHWAEDYINELALKCEVKGYTDPTGKPLNIFGPNNNLLRAELVSILTKCLKIQETIPENSNSKPFQDVEPTAWYASAIKSAKDLGWIEGNADGTFAPLAPITRAEATKIILLSKYQDKEIQNSIPSFTDTPDLSPNANPWFYKYIAFASKQKIIDGYSNGNFGPNDLLTRGQAAKIIVNTIY